MQESNNQNPTTQPDNGVQAAAQGRPPERLRDKFRCVAFWLLWSVFIVFMACLLMICFWLPALWCYQLARFWCWGSIHLARLTLGINWRITGLENLDGLPPSVIAANHESAWETLALTVMMPTLTWVIKYELMFLPFFGQVVFLTRPIMLKRSQKFRALSKTVEQGQVSLKQGRWVCIFPQGTRQQNVDKPHFHTGAAALAAQANCPLVLIAHNSGKYWGSGLLDKRPGTIELLISRPLSPTDKNGQPRTTKDLHQEMSQSLHQMRSSLN